MKRIKNLIIAVIVLMITGCVAYIPYVNVVPENIQYGSTEILGVGTIEKVKEMLTNNTIMYKTFENGIETDEILIDAGTRAKFKIYFNAGNIKMMCYWGITSEVKSQMVLWAGYTAASAYSTDEWYRATYESKGDKYSDRSSMVFSYGYQLMKQVDTYLITK